MFDTGCEPSIQTHSILMKHLMVEKHNISIYNADIWRITDFEIITTVFEKMLEHGCVPNVKTYDKLIIGLCKVEHLSVALGLLNHMRENGISPSEIIHNSLLSGCCKLGMHEEALRLLDSMMECNHLAHLESYRLLICWLFEQSNKEKVGAIFHSLLSCGFIFFKV